MLYTKKTFEYDHPLEEADVVLIGIPWDFSQTGYPTRYGPMFIREAIRGMIGFDPETKVNIFEKFRFCDLGDVDVVPGNWKLTEERVTDTVRSVLEKNPKILPVFLGGDHLITLGILNAMKGVVKGKTTVVDFDAHRDLLPDFQGERFSHVTWANHVINDKNFDLVQIGTRSWSEEEDKFKVRSSIGKTGNPVYLTIDLDVFDPSVAPEVGTPEPNGMDFEGFLKILGDVANSNVIGMDIVECGSQKTNTTTALLAANVIKKFFSYRK